MKTYAFEVTELIAEVRCDLPGHFKAAVASEAMEMALICKRHMNTKVIEVNELKSGVSRGLLASEVIWRPLVRGSPFTGGGGGVEQSHFLRNKMMRKTPEHM